MTPLEHLEPMPSIDRGLEGCWDLLSIPADALPDLPGHNEPQDSMDASSAAASVNPGKEGVPYGQEWGWNPDKLTVRHEEVPVS